MFKTYSKEISGIFLATLTFFLPKFGIPVFDSLPALVDEAVMFIALLTAYIGRMDKGDITVAGFRKISRN